jgi:hypothetical protein
MIACWVSAIICQLCPSLTSYLTNMSVMRPLLQVQLSNMHWQACAAGMFRQSSNLKSLTVNAVVRQLGK